MGFRVINEPTVRHFQHHQSGLFPGQSPAFAISICGVDEVPAFHDRAVTHLLSIHGHQLDRPPTPRWIDNGHHYTLQFDDVERSSQDRVAPAHEDVEQILQIGRNLVNQSLVLPVHLLIHCQAGVSRSTAAALAILMQVYGLGREEDAVRHLFRIRPQARPHQRIVLVTDLLLGCRGQLVAAVAWA